MLFVGGESITWKIMNEKSGKGGKGEGSERNERKRAVRRDGRRDIFLGCIRTLYVRLSLVDRKENSNKSKFQL